jgi:hypothetical protein
LLVCQRIDFKYNHKEPSNTGAVCWRNQFYFITARLGCFFLRYYLKEKAFPYFTPPSSVLESGNKETSV